MKNGQVASTGLSSVLAFGLVAVLVLLILPAAQAQTYTVLYRFTRGTDGADPMGGLTMDAAGSLYGTAFQGGSQNCQGGCGTVFKLSHSSSGWTLSPLYNFSGTDGASPEGRLIFGPDGRLYGTTGQGGMGCGSSGCGVVFAMSPPASFCHSVVCYWTEDVLYQFSGGNDGSRPTGDTVFDAAGNFYGTAENSGAAGLGTAYELSRSGGGWTQTTINTFNSSNGANPYGGFTIDAAGNLYGTTKLGGQYMDGGTVFELSNTPSGWSETILHSFNGTEGFKPVGSVVRDTAGNVYGTTAHGGQGAGGGGQVFQLTPSGGSWMINLLFGFHGLSGPWSDLAMDRSGNLYGTSLQDGNGFGNIFRLTFSGGSWVYTDLHDFDGVDGANPHGNIVIDANGNLYGTAVAGGLGNGVVWELTP
jgi:uncharacterized repeat protein (TIGR03803 family)